jgi:hypothetical protein
MKIKSFGFWKLTVITTVTILMALNAAADEAEDLAKKLANPVASLISIPIQANYDKDIGPNEDGSVWRINIQPVIPVTLNDNWNLISRTILPIVDQSDVPVKGMGESGIGDTVQSFFFSPKKPTPRRIIWGIGPVIMLPTASDEVLGAEKWGIGPTGVILKQSGPWTYGVLVNHIESFAGDDNRADVSVTFLQPYLTYITKTKTAFGLNTESTYDWENEEWSVPINFNILQMLKIGPQIIQVGVGTRYWADSPDNGPEGWGARMTLTFLYPK